MTDLAQASREGTTPETQTNIRSSSPATHPADAGREGTNIMTQTKSESSSPVVSDLVVLQRKRKFCIQQQSKADRSIEALIASTIGYRIDQDEKQRKALFAQAAAIRKAVEKGGDHDEFDNHNGNVSTLSPLILASAGNRGVWDELRKTTEAKMRDLAKQLPVYSFANAVKGFGDLGLAIIAAEAGIPIGEYRTVSGLWKRMGLAVIGGERQRKKTDAQQALLHGYAPRRRSEIWVVADVMFRHQWAGDKDVDGKDPKKTGRPVATPAHATGPYGAAYGRRRAATADRVANTADLSTSNPDRWTPLRCLNDARRVMSKELLKDLWVEWRRVDRGE